MSGSYGEDIRDVKRPYRKKAFQTGYSQKGLCCFQHTVATTHLFNRHYATNRGYATGGGTHTFRRAVRATPESLDGGTAIAGAFYPWHTSPKPESANLVQRQKVDLNATPLPDLNYIDAVVINVSDGSVGTTSWIGGVPTATPFVGVAPAPAIAQNTGLLTATPGAPTSTTQAKTVSASTNPTSPQATGGTTFAPTGTALITPVLTKRFTVFLPSDIRKLPQALRCHLSNLGRWFIVYGMG